MNGVDVRNATHDEAVEVIRNASSPVRFMVQSLVDSSCVSIVSFFFFFLTPSLFLLAAYVVILGAGLDVDGWM